MQGIHPPNCSAGDSMAALNISNGISEYICSIVWRPLDGDVAEAGLCGSTVGDIGVGGAVPFGAISRPAGSVATRKSNTSSFSRCAYCSKFGRRVSGADGGASPPSGGGDDAESLVSWVEMVEHFYFHDYLYMPGYYYIPDGSLDNYFLRGYTVVAFDYI